MIDPAFEILNQRGTPMFFSDVFANRPTAGIVGRIFISTDTYAFYRDTGSGWDLIGGPGTGTITGSGAVSQVAFWSGSSTITGENNLWWDFTNNHFGINTNTPGTAADIHHDQSTILQLNQTTAANDTRIAFQNSGASLWRIGNFYNAGANDWGIYDVIGAIQPLTIAKTTGQTFIGSKTTASGRLVVNSASSDAHIQVVGANAPSIRIDNAGTGATQRLVFGLATATNNFIQGSTAGDICISTASASPLLFGMWQTINASEVMRISTGNNLIVGGTTDTGNKLMVYGVIGFNTNGQTYTISSYKGTNSAGFNIFIGGGGNFSVGQVGNAILGSRNVSLGETAFYSNTEGWGNVAIGRDCMYDNTTGLNNTAIGYACFLDNISGSYNTAIGVSAGRFDNSGNVNETSNYGTYLGVNARGSNGSTNEITIGYNAQSGGSNTATLGNTSILKTFLNGNVLIGTTTDAGWKTEINGKLKTTGNTCISGTISIASGVTSTIYTIPSTTTAGGLYHVVVGVLAGGNIYTASGIVTASSWNTQADFTSIYDGANVTLSLSGMDIQIKNDGFGTFTWTYSIHFIPINNA